jgi:hypothetical protein
MQAAKSSQMSVNLYQTTRRYNPENSNLHTRSRENIKSHTAAAIFRVNVLWYDFPWASRRQAAGG